jgi:AraC-like DNA-binding protein
MNKMNVTPDETQPQGLEAFLKSQQRDVIGYRQLFDLISKAMACTDGMVISTLPRGGLGMVQPPRPSEVMAKSYAKDYGSEDRLTWQVIAKQQPMRGKDAWEAGAYETSRYFREFLQANGLARSAAAPLKGPVFAAYAGALHVYRTADQPDFTDDDLQQLANIAKQLDEAVDRVRASRQPEDCPTGLVWSHQPAARLFILDGQLNAQQAGGDPGALDERLRQQMIQHAKHRLENLAETEPVAPDRLQLPDQRGDLWTFRVVTYRQYPALGSGPFVFFCMQPEACDWATVRPSDFAADVELSRLVPALRFMRQEYHRSPTLVEISKQVHLSPFHFHRRFTELLGLTPKHFLLECQISEAKRQLMARQKELAEIATDCGFAHQSHFTSRFKQATGLTPTRWRRLALDLQSGAADYY